MEIWISVLAVRQISAFCLDAQLYFSFKKSFFDLCELFIVSTVK